MELHSGLSHWRESEASHPKHTLSDATKICQNVDISRREKIGMRKVAEGSMSKGISKTI